MYKTNPLAILFTILLTAVIVGGGVYWYLNLQDISVEPNEEANVEEENVEEDTQQQVTQTEVTVEDIRDAFSSKYPNRDYSSHTITIENNYQDQYVEGGVGAPEGGGAHYWATKVNDEWIIVQEAQDSVPCSIFEPYNFPQDIIGNDCY